MYSASFKLVMDNEGMVTPHVVFDPSINPAEGEAPAIYGYIADVALQFLQEVNLVDENMQWTSDDAQDIVMLDLSSTTKDRTTH